jgi:hypothetical protein
VPFFFHIISTIAENISTGGNSRPQKSSVSIEYKHTTALESKKQLRNASPPEEISAAPYADEITSLSRGG